jgi:hypothetical protein
MAKDENLRQGDQVRWKAIHKPKKSDLTDDDLAHMRKVAGYVKRHRAQPPKQEKIEDSRWRYSLMNWGHDPLKK